MESNGCNSSSSMSSQSEEDMAMMNNMELRRGPWTVEEDLTLINYISNNGEGRWNSLARCAGLKRTGKSCRLRWLNYLRPDVRRGNITLEEQLLILELHSRWGNRWSKIAQHLPGRTDNEIKNYWRTRVQKHAKQLKCDVNSKQFKDTMRYLWMPRLVERIQANASADQNVLNFDQSATSTGHVAHNQKAHAGIDFTGYTPENSSPMSDLTDQYNYNSAAASSSVPVAMSQNPNSDQFGYFQGCHDQAIDAYHPDRSTLTSAYNVDQSFAGHQVFADLQAEDQQHHHHHHHHHHHQQQTNEMNWNMDGLDQSDMGLWNGVDDIWFLQQQFNTGI